MKSAIVNILLVAIVSVVDCAQLYAQKAIEVEITHNYPAISSLPPEVAKIEAIESAKIESIRQYFGTYLSAQSMSIIETTSKTEYDLYYQNVSSCVQGEWIETIGEPKVNVIGNPFEDKIYTIQVQIKGKIRQYTSAPVRFSCKILRNGTNDQFNDLKFMEGDTLYLSFMAPIDGYVAVFYQNADKVQCLLPYSTQKDGAYGVSANKRYVFFSSELNHNPNIHVDPIFWYLQNAEAEFGHIIVVFSKNEFTKPVCQTDKANPPKGSQSLPPVISNKDFMRWYSDCCIHDKSMTQLRELITIESAE